MHHWSHLICGSHTTLLSVKLAQQLMKASRTDSQSNRLGLVLSLHTDSQSWEPHRELLETLEIPNNFISYKQVASRYSTLSSCHLVDSCHDRIFIFVTGACGIDHPPI